MTFLLFWQFKLDRSVRLCKVSVSLLQLTPHHLPKIFVFVFQFIHFQFLLQFIELLAVSSMVFLLCININIINLNQEMYSVFFFRVIVCYWGLHIFYVLFLFFFTENPLFCFSFISLFCTSTTFLLVLSGLCSLLPFCCFLFYNFMFCFLKIH